jgi:hypothetical protein
MRKYLFVTLLIFAYGIAFSEAADPNAAIFGDVFLSPDHKEDWNTIKKELESHSIHKVKAQFFRKGNPPTNVQIGSGISAEVARMVIEVAIQYNRGVTDLLPQFRFFPNQVSVGTSAFDESVPVAVRPEDLERLRERSLSTSEFHRLYRTLTHEAADPHAP